MIIKLEIKILWLNMFFVFQIINSRPSSQGDYEIVMSHGFMSHGAINDTSSIVTLGWLSLQYGVIRDR